MVDSASTASFPTRASPPTPSEAPPAYSVWPPSDNDKNFGPPNNENSTYRLPANVWTDDNPSAGPSRFPTTFQGNEYGGNPSSAFVQKTPVVPLWNKECRGHMATMEVEETRLSKVLVELDKDQPSHSQLVELWKVRDKHMKNISDATVSLQNIFSLRDAKPAPGGLSKTYLKKKGPMTQPKRG